MDIGSRRELFVDDALIESMPGSRRILRRPTPREISLVLDAPWEGNNCAFVTVLEDNGLYRMTYRGSQLHWRGGTVTYPHGQVTCYAESTDGIHWERPELGIVEFNGSRQNNIILPASKGSHNFSPFMDNNPDCDPAERFKALGGLQGDGGLFAFTSPDCIHWSRTQETPLITKGAFDSQNIAFWDSTRGEYRCYYREFRDGRDIMTTTSSDFRTWSEPVWLRYLPNRLTELYTNQICPYPRAPHILLGFPARYITGREKLTQLNHEIADVSERFGTDYTDTGFMSSRDRESFSIWGEAFVRPGPIEKGTWVYGDNYQNWGIVQTASDIAACPDELSFYLSEGSWRGSSSILRRHSLRIDGFVSVTADGTGGELVTKPIIFSGNTLSLNLETSANGGARVELQDDNGNALNGFTLDKCRDLFGDGHDIPVSWTGNPSLATIAGTPVKMRIVLKDADLYSFRFANKST